MADSKVKITTETVKATTNLGKKLESSNISVSSYRDSDNVRIRPVTIHVRDSKSGQFKIYSEYAQGRFLSKNIKTG